MPVDRYTDHRVVLELRQGDVGKAAVGIAQHGRAGGEHRAGQADTRAHFRALFAGGHAEGRLGADQVLVRVVQADTAILGVEQLAGMADDAGEEGSQLELARDLFHHAPQGFRLPLGARGDGFRMRGHAACGRNLRYRAKQGLRVSNHPLGHRKSGCEYGKRPPGEWRSPGRSARIRRGVPAIPHLGILEQCWRRVCGTAGGHNTAGRQMSGLTLVGRVVQSGSVRAAM